jgi:putative spermidine/putrescine transport system ATP-binding protein
VYDVELTGITKRYHEKIVVEDFNLGVQRGEFVSLLGPSGCGKTTTLNMIAGFIDPDGGSISLKGRVINGIPPHKRGLGMVFQTYSLFPHMSVRENVAYGLKTHRVPKAEIIERVDRVLALVRLEGYGDRIPKHLSGGQRQRVAIARALVTDPQILLLDEPLSNLDAKLREELREELKRLHNETGITTVFVTHDQEEALSLSDRIVVMNLGAIEQIGTPKEIYGSPRTEFVHTFIGRSNRFSGTVTVARNQQVHVTTAGGLGIELASVADVIGGDEVNVYVRPEAVTISAAPLDGHLTQIDGRIQAMTFLGAITEYTVASHGEKILVRVQNESDRFQLDDPVTCWWDPRDALVVPRKVAADGTLAA